MSEDLILGIDPGSLITGYGIIKVTQKGVEAIDFGCIRSGKLKEANSKYSAIFEGVLELIDTHKPKSLAIEKPFVDKNISSALKLGKACGVIMAAAALRKIPIFEYAPSRAKKAVVGKGLATKEQVKHMVKVLLSLSTLPEPSDAADALAIAICHANEIKFKSSVCMSL